MQEIGIAQHRRVAFGVELEPAAQRLGLEARILGDVGGKVSEVDPLLRAAGGAAFQAREREHLAHHVLEAIRFALDPLE